MEIKTSTQTTPKIASIKDPSEVIPPPTGNKIPDLDSIVATSADGPTATAQSKNPKDILPAPTQEETGGKGLPQIFGQTSRDLRNKIFGKIPTNAKTKIGQGPSLQNVPIPETKETTGIVTKTQAHVKADLNPTDSSLIDASIVIPTTQVKNDTIKPTTILPANKAFTGTATPSTVETRTTMINATEQPAISQVYSSTAELQQGAVLPHPRGGYTTVYRPISSIPSATNEELRAMLNAFATQQYAVRSNAWTHKFTPPPPNQTIMPIFNTTRRLISLDRTVMTTSTNNAPPAPNDGIMTMFEEAMLNAQTGLIKLSARLKSDGYTIPIEADPVTRLLPSPPEPFQTFATMIGSAVDYTGITDLIDKDIFATIVIGSQLWGLYILDKPKTLFNTQTTNNIIISQILNDNLVTQKIINPIFGQEGNTNIAFFKMLQKILAASGTRFRNLGSQGIREKISAVKILEEFCAETDPLTADGAEKSITYMEKNRLAGSKIRAWYHACLPNGSSIDFPSGGDENRSVQVAPSPLMASQLLIACCFGTSLRKELVAQQFYLFTEFSVYKTSDIVATLLEMNNLVSRDASTLTPLMDMLTGIEDDGEMLMAKETSPYMEMITMQAETSSITDMRAPWILLCSILWFVVFPHSARDIAHVLWRNIFQVLNKVWINECAQYLAEHGFATDDASNFMNIVNSDYLSGERIPSIMKLKPNEIKQPHFKRLRQLIEPVGEVFACTKADAAEFPSIEKNRKVYVPYKFNPTRMTGTDLETRFSQILQFVVEFSKSFIPKTKGNMMGKPSLALIESFEQHLSYSSRMLSHEIAGVYHIMADYPLTTHDFFDPALESGPTPIPCITSLDPAGQNNMLPMYGASKTPVKLGAVLFPILKIDSVFETRNMKDQPGLLKEVEIAIPEVPSILAAYQQISMRVQKISHALTFAQMTWQGNATQPSPYLSRMFQRAPTPKVRNIIRMFSQLCKMIGVEEEFVASIESITGIRLFEDPRFKNWMLWKCLDDARLVSTRNELPDGLLLSKLEMMEPFFLGLYEQACKFLTAPNSIHNVTQQGLYLRRQQVITMGPNIDYEFDPEYEIIYEPGQTFRSRRAPDQVSHLGMMIDGKLYFDPPTIPKTLLVIAPNGTHQGSITKASARAFILAAISSGRLAVSLPNIIYTVNVTTTMQPKLDLQYNLLDGILSSPYGAVIAVPVNDATNYVGNYYSPASLRPTQWIWPKNGTNWEPNVLMRRIFDFENEEDVENFVELPDTIWDNGKFVPGQVPRYSNGVEKLSRPGDISLLNYIPVFEKNVDFTLPTVEVIIAQDFSQV